jgi:hypothetical protein
MSVAELFDCAVVLSSIELTPCRCVIPPATLEITHDIQGT